MPPAAAFWCATSQAGSFKSRCLVYETRYGAITVPARDADELNGAPSVGLQVGQHTSKAWASGRSNGCGQLTLISAGLHRDEYWRSPERLEIAECPKR